MSAAILLKKPDAILLLSDAAVYQSHGPSAGVVGRFRDKCVILPELHCAMTVLGPYLAQELVAAELTKRFTSFDEVIDGGVEVLRELFATFDESVSLHRLSASVWLAGWSKRRARAEGYSITLASDQQYEELMARRVSTNGMLPGKDAPFVFQLCPGLVASPMPRISDLFDAGIAPRADVTTFTEDDLLRCMEAQRRIRITGGAEYFYGIGGWATLTRVDREGITQRRLHEWSEDSVGAEIAPVPLDLKQWRAQHDGIEAEAPVELSRVRREMLARRERKAARRAA